MALRIALATQNRDKIREIEAILSPLDVELVHPDALAGMPAVLEDGRTLEENALKKARAIRDFTGLSALADDTGLEVDTLGGAPGVRSARFAGEEGAYDKNNSKLLEALQGVPVPRRTARFRCVIALALSSEVAEAAGRSREAGGGAEGRIVTGRPGHPDALVTEGILEGMIAEERRGGFGFGFDPLFIVPRLGRTLAEIEPAEKNRISHRYRALVEMRELVVRLGLAGGHGAGRRER